MMREMTEGCAKTLNALFFLWMALMNVYPGDFQVNSFFGIFCAGSAAHQRFSGLSKNCG
jgi:hypothetical protein